jgi:hypothetical protein
MIRSCPVVILNRVAEAQFRKHSRTCEKHLRPPRGRTRLLRLLVERAMRGSLALTVGNRGELSSVDGPPTAACRWRGVCK